MRDRSPTSGARQRRAPLIVSESQHNLGKVRCMLKILSALLLALSCGAAGNVTTAGTTSRFTENVAGDSEGEPIVSTIFSPNATLFIWMSHLISKLSTSTVPSTEAAPRITFFNQTSKGKKRAHYSYALHEEENKLTLRELDGNGNFRFDCVGTHQPEKRLLECDAPRAPKPTRGFGLPYLPRLERAAFSNDPLHGQPMNG